VEAIKGLLREELENSLRMKERYEEALNQLPKGVLVKKRIKGHDYYYLLYRDGGRVRLDYKGGASEAELEASQHIKEARARHRKLLSQVNRQIKYLRGILRDKKPV
jgi:hypothetical protein